MSLLETVVTMAILALLGASSIAGLAEIQRSHAVAAAAQELAAEIELHGAAAVITGRSVQIHFSSGGYEVNPSLENKGGADKRFFSPAMLLLEARFGSDQIPGPLLKLGSDGVSSPGRIVLAAPATGRRNTVCTITRALRGLTSVRCKNS